MPGVSKDTSRNPTKGDLEKILKQPAKVDIKLQIRDNPLKTNSKNRDYRFAVTPH